VTVDGPACPACAGRQMPDHPAGWLAWRHSNLCALRDAEDARHAADVDLAGGRVTQRPATTTEMSLLSALGHPLPRDLTTRLEPVTAGIIRRSWSALETTAAATTEGTTP